MISYSMILIMVYTRRDFTFVVISGVLYRGNKRVMGDAVNKNVKMRGTTPVERCGALSVKGNQLVDRNGNAVALRGVSTHGLSWYPQYNRRMLKDVIIDWHILSDGNPGQNKEQSLVFFKESSKRYR